MKHYILSLFALLLIGAADVRAQDAGTSYDPVFESFFTFDWEISVPASDQFVDATSTTGGRLEYRKMLDNNFSLGFDVSWNSFYKYQPYQTYHLNSTTDITTDLYKYNYTLPLALTAHKYFSVAGGHVVPFAGLGLGATYCRPSVFFNIYELYEENWGFLVRPEVGAIVKLGSTGDWGILAGARYSYSTNKETSFKIDKLKALSFQLGFAWMY
jgi:hypothetical protein